MCPKQPSWCCFSPMKWWSSTLFRDNRVSVNVLIEISKCRWLVSPPATHAQIRKEREKERKKERERERRIHVFVFALDQCNLEESLEKRWICGRNQYVEPKKISCDIENARCMLHASICMTSAHLWAGCLHIHTHTHRYTHMHTHTRMHIHRRRHRHRHRHRHGHRHRHRHRHRGRHGHRHRRRHRHKHRHIYTNTVMLTRTHTHTH